MSESFFYNISIKVKVLSHCGYYEYRSAEGRSILFACECKSLGAPFSEHSCTPSPEYTNSQERRWQTPHSQMLYLYEYIYRFSNIERLGREAWKKTWFLSHKWLSKLPTHPNLPTLDCYKKPFLLAKKTGGHEARWKECFAFNFTCSQSHVRNRGVPDSKNNDEYDRRAMINSEQNYPKSLFLISSF